MILGWSGVLGGLWIVIDGPSYAIPFSLIRARPKEVKVPRA